MSREGTGKSLAAAGLGGAALLAGWLAAQRRDRREVEEDPRAEALFAEFGGTPWVVRAPDGTDLEARVFGPEGAPTVIFIHGWTVAGEFWKLQVRELSERLRVVTFDLRGHGQSDRAANGDYSIESFAGDLDAVIDACVPDGERALLVGHSLGAMTIVAWAGTHPERVDARAAGAVLINTAVNDLISESLVVEGVPDSFARIQRLIGEGIFSARAPIPAVTAPISFRVIRRFVVGPDASPAQTAFCERLIVSCPADVRAACGGTLSRLDLRTALHRLDIPTLMIAGELDLLTPTKHAREMGKELPQLLDLIELPRSGHMSPVEHPEEVSELIAELAGVRASA